ncbi:MAG: DUF5808 domain-containing protein [Marinilabiliales bacterium]|nr:DUF5808 domain-containing protein [Marinilabiliales bacterium]
MTDFIDPIQDPDHYKWALIYWNRQDRRLFVPKRLGIGYTLNFANPLAYLVLLLLAGAILLPFLLQ